MSNSATIMLIPDSGYVAARPKIKDHHLTVAYFGPASDLSPAGKARLIHTAKLIARGLSPVPAKANGIGIFDAGSDGIAVVDLIDGIGSFNVRRLVENTHGYRSGYTLDEVRVDYTHGFTPHITREYLPREDDFYGEITPDLIDNLTFQFVAIGAWIGDEKHEFEL